MASTREFTALDVLEVASKQSPVDPLVGFLKSHDIKDETYESECWQVVCDVMGIDDPPATVAATHRIEVINSFPRTAATCAPECIERLISLIKTYSIKCSYASYADSYVAACLKAMLPPEVAALVPRDLPPYPHAAAYLGSECNETMRPILKTPLRTVLNA